jgi:hypothetical protein
MTFSFVRWDNKPIKQYINMLKPKIKVAVVYWFLHNLELMADLRPRVAEMGA